MKPAEVSTPSDREVQVKRSFAAPAKFVWQAYSEPDLMRRWLQGPPGWSMPICEMDVRVGGKYRWRWRSEEGGQEFGFSGELLEVALHSRIVHTQHYDAGDLNESMGSEPYVVTVTFHEANGITKSYGDKVLFDDLSFNIPPGSLVGVIGAMVVRYWFAARRLGFAIERDGSIVALPGPSLERLKRVAGGAPGP